MAEALQHLLTEVAWDGELVLLRGHAFLDGVDGWRTDTRAIVRHRAQGREYSYLVKEVPTPHLSSDGHDYSTAGFEAIIDVAGGQLQPGIWDIYLGVRGATGEKVVRLGTERSEQLDVLPYSRILDDGTTVTPYFTQGSPRGLSLDLRPGRVGEHVEACEAEWIRPGTLRLTGRAALELPPNATLQVMFANSVIPATARADGRRLEWSADLAVDALSTPPTFSVRPKLRVALTSGQTFDLSIEAANDPGLGKFGRRGIAKIASTRPLTIEVGRRSIRQGLRRRIRRILRSRR